MPNINTFRTALLAAFGDLTGANNVNDFYTKLPVAVAAQASSAPSFANQPLIVQPTPVAVNTTATTTAAALIGGLITSTTAAAVAMTLPLATDLNTALIGIYGTLAVGDAIEFTVVNTGGTNALTVTTNTGWTLVGVMAVAALTSGTFRATRTSATAYVLYRV